MSNDNKVNGIIYKITNSIDKKVYIGQTINSLESRISKHISLANKDSNRTYLHRALKKHGKYNFEWEIIKYCYSKEELDEMEFNYIKQYNSMVPNGYNMTMGGEGTIGRQCSFITRKKISESKKGIKASNVTKNKLSKLRRGIKKSSQHINNVASSVSKYWEIVYPDNTKEVIKNLSAFCRNNNLSDRGMWMVAHGYRTHHKNYKCKKLS